MCNVADQFFILLVILYLLFGRLPQSLAHFLKITAQLTDLIITLCIQNKIQISFFDILRCFLELFQRNVDSIVNPHRQHTGCHDQNDHNRNKHVSCKRLDLMNHRQAGDHKDTALCPIRKSQIHLLDERLYIFSDVNAAVRLADHVIILRQLWKQFIHALIASGIIKAVSFSHNQKRIFLLQPVIYLIQIITIQKCIRSSAALFLDLFKIGVRCLIQHLHGI